jgi:UDP-glucose 4-epimerase
MSVHLITGGAGFIGSHVADALVARGDEVIVLDDLTTGRRENLQHLIESGDVELIEGSTLDETLVDELMGRVDTCLHLASVVGVDLVMDRPLESLLRNVRGVDIVTAAAARHGRRLLFTSTSEVYGKRSDGALREDADRLLGTPSTSRWTYAEAKAFGEMLAYGYAREYGAETIVVRLFNTVGPRQAAAYGMVVPRFVHQALAGENLTVYGDGTQTRCFTHVGDTVDGILALLGSDGALGQAFNIGSRAEFAITDLAQRVIERAESTSGIRFIPYEAAYQPGFEELGRRKPDTSAIHALTGWRPRRTLEQAIDDTIRYQRELDTGQVARVGRFTPENDTPAEEGAGVDLSPGSANGNGNGAARDGSAATRSVT